MNSFIEELNRRIAEKEKRFQEVVAERTRLVQEEQALGAQLMALKTIREGELKGNGHSTVPPENAKQVSTSLPTNGHKNDKSVRVTILRYIRESGDPGITRKDIAARLEADKIKVHRNYPYVVISKLKEKDLIDERNQKLSLK